MCARVCVQLLRAQHKEYFALYYGYAEKSFHASSKLSVLSTLDQQTENDFLINKDGALFYDIKKKQF